MARFRFMYVALLCVAASVGAEGEIDYSLAEISITAERVGEALVATPSSSSTITRAEMDARGAATVAAAIETAPGVSVSGLGPAGSRSSPSIRGSTTNQVLVLVDGVRANDALTGLVDLSSIPEESIQKIEVLRAGASALYGPDAVGGVINIVTNSSAARPRLSFENLAYIPTAGYAGYGFGKTGIAPQASALVDSQRLGISWAPRLGDAVLSLSGGFSRSANAYAYSDSNEETRLLENADFLGADASVGLKYPLGSGLLAARLSGLYQEKGVPGSTSSPSPRARETDGKADASLRYATESFLSDTLSLEALAWARHSGIDFGDPGIPSSSHNALDSLGLEARQKALLGEALSIDWGAKASWESADGSDVGSPHRLSLGVRAGALIEAGRLSLKPAAYYDWYSDFSPGALGAMIGAAWALDKGDTLKAQVSRAYRVPTFSDLYWPTSGGAEGNPRLGPETAWEADIGFEREREGFSYRAGAFARYALDVILWQTGSDGVWRPENFGCALYPGLEQELRVKMADGYYANASWDFLYGYVLSGAFSLADDKRIPMTPVHSLSGTLGRDGKGISWSATARYEGLRYLTTANAASIPSYFKLDAILRARVSRGVEIYLAADNLFSERYAIVQGYPMPGTAIRTGVKTEF